MTALYTPTTGDEPTAADLATWVPILAHKTTDQTLASSTTFQNDTVLAATVAANVKYEFRLYGLIRASNSTNGGMKVQFSLPSGANIDNATFRFGGNTSPGAPTNANGGVGTITLTTSNVLFMEEGLLVMGSTAGTFQWQWAQNSSSTNNTIMSAGSYLLLRQVG